MCLASVILDVSTCSQDKRGGYICSGVQEYTAELDQKGVSGVPKALSRRKIAGASAPHAPLLG